MESVWFFSLIAPWVGAAALGIWPRRLDGLAALFAVVVTWLTAIALSAAQALGPATATYEVLARWELNAGLGLELIWGRDGLTALFGLLSAWIAALVMLFSWAYMPHALAGTTRRPAGFYALMVGFTGAMLALVASGNLLQFYLFWELTSLASFLLIGYFHTDEDARIGASRSLWLTTAGSLALLIGFMLLQTAWGSWNLPMLLTQPAAGTGALAAAAALVAVGALSKSAQFPFSSWLPGAMAAPTPVSAFLHSAALVAAGVYLIARFFPLLSDQWTWGALLIGSGLIGGLVSGVVALRQSTIKGLLAYSTISQYAFICLAFGLGTLEGAEAGLYAFFIHGILKAGLFMVAGAVTHLTEEKRFKGLGGLARGHPALAAMAAVLALSLGGVPVLGGFYYKEELLYAAYDHQAWLLLGAMLVGGMLTFLYMMRFLQEIFWGEPAAAGPVEPLPWAIALPIGVLAALALVTGSFPDWMNRGVLNAAISSVVGEPVHFVVELEFGQVLLLSLGVLALGLALWWLYRCGIVPQGWARRVPREISLGGGRLVALYGAVSRGILARHSGNLRQYLRWELLAVLALIAVCWSQGDWRDWAWWGTFDAAIALMLAVTLLASGATLFVRTHITAIIALTIAGFALASVFALMHAPNIALAQVLVETLATIAIVVALRQSQLVHPQRTTILTAGKRDWGRWGIALVFGAAVGWATFWAGRRIPPESVGARYAEEGHALTGMHDLVTAILTDFRALDTVIEILVFASAAFAVMALFRQRGGGDAA